MIWYKKLDRSFFRFVTMHAFDRWRDTTLFLIASPLWHSMQHGNNLCTELIAGKTAPASLSPPPAIPAGMGNNELGHLATSQSIAVASSN